MASAACDVHMSARQGEFSSGGVAEGCISPGCRAVTSRAILREASSPVVRIFRAVPIRQMTGDAGGCQAGECIILVTLTACYIRMGTRQREFGCTAMIEVCVCPGAGVVANRAILREAGSAMVGVFGAVPIRPVTRYA